MHVGCVGLDFTTLMRCVGDPALVILLSIVCIYSPWFITRQKHYDFGCLFLYEFTRAPMSYGRVIAPYCMMRVGNVNMRRKKESITNVRCYGNKNAYDCCKASVYDSERILSMD